ncbi:hypothetical protein [Pedobacter sp. D749]|uniref:hypothetical protein n=1 Tax=Pedobacter sp. D749 TaxID=2856523 RepID=UPI001C5871DD|nr:hypothetical protein [Pedobacter sp. D749]QXU42847.1 hypothetical protein KYH19_04405 [Pedobacter sp. D749]
MNELFTEFEELLKIQEFSLKKELRIAYLCTYEKIAKALKDEYSENIDDKVNRWVEVTKLQYFEKVAPITYFFQAKMLYRDGFYESSIMLSRSISEMVCYELLSRFPHPFGELSLIETPLFRLFVDFLALPKRIAKKIFEDDIVSKLGTMEDKNFIKGSYTYKKESKDYLLKIEVAREKKNQKRFFDLFNMVSFQQPDTFSDSTHKLFHELYDIGNGYVHSKVSAGSAKEDAFKVLMMLTQILSGIFGPTTGLEGKVIKSGYSDFPDICKGMNFAIEVGLTVEDAQRIYYNIPAQRHFESAKNMIGTWNGRWRTVNGQSARGTLTCQMEPGDMITASIVFINSDGFENKMPLEIRLFDGYIHLIEFDPSTMQHSSTIHLSFELDFFEKDLLLGNSLSHSGKAIFERQGTAD